MSTPLENPKFDIEQFRTELTQLWESFGNNSRITLGLGTTPDGNRQKEENAKLDYKKILNLCADALLQTNDKDTVASLINREFVEYCHKGILMFGRQNDKITFWQNVALKVAKKASGAVETTATAQRNRGETQEATVQTAAITAEVGTAAQEAIQETGRNLSEVFASLPENHYTIDRSDVMQIGDYIEITRARAYAFGFKPEEGKDRSQLVKVRITKITRGHATCNIEVELDGQTIRIDGSLFYNFGKTFVH